MPPIRCEPSSLSEVDQTAEFRNSLSLLQDSGFLHFLQKIDRHNNEVALQFAKSFKNGHVNIGPLKFKVTEKSIAAATGLQNTGVH